MSANVAKAIADARREWAGNRRLRFGVLAIAGIVVLYLLLLMQDWRSALANEYTARTEHLYKMKSLAGQEEWLLRAQSTSELRKAMEAELPEVDTAGLAQAQVQGWIRDVATALDEDVQVETLEPVPVEGRPGLWRVPVSVSGQLDPARYLELLRRIESRNTLSVIEEAAVRNRANPTFTLTIVSYFRIREAANAPG